MPRSESPPRSRHRPRSRSPRAKTRNRRSRSTSRDRRRSRSFSESASDDSSRRRRKREHKKHKKHKKDKQRRAKESAVDTDRASAHVPLSSKPPIVHDEVLEVAHSETVEQQPPNPSQEPPARDVRSFFERVRAQEAAKEAVGTVHASGVRALNPTARVELEQWECVKRGCGEKNFKRAAACSKCGAMKRLSEWR